MLSAFALSVGAETNWRLYAGGMYAKAFKAEDKPNETIMFQKPSQVPTKVSYTAWLGIDVQFSLKDKFFIESGLNLREVPYLFGHKVTDSDQYTGEKYSWYEIETSNGYSHRDILSVPLRFGYKLHLRGKNQFEFAVGPYFGADFDADYYIGLSPVVTYRHRALSLSFHWENPMFMNTSNNHFKNNFAFTIGVNFTGRSPNWDNILIGLEAANAVLGTANEAISQYYEAQNGSDGGSSYSSGNGNRNSGGSGFSLNDQQAYNKDKSIYERYDSQLASHFAGNQTMSSSSVRQAQKTMIKLRTKWEKKGKSFPRSANENR